MRIKGLSQFSTIGAGLSCGALLLFMFAAVCPVVTDGANAANGYNIALNDTSPIPTSVQLTWGTSPSETLDPTSGEGKVITSAATLQLGNSGGYTVYISGNPNLTGQATGKTIPSTTSDKTLSQLENQWGYYSVIGDAVATFDPSHSFKGYEHHPGRHRP